MRKLKLTQGKVALVDDEDYERLSQYKWYAVWDGHHWRAATTLQMARVVMGNPEGMVVDHKNRNGLDNQKANLRICTQSENCRNAFKRRGKASSRFRGVNLYRPTGRWMARVGIHGKRIFLGYFDTEIEAARAYNKAAKEHHGGFACLNEVPSDSA